jgi:hypothetical protein
LIHVVWLTRVHHLIDQRLVILMVENARLHLNEWGRSFSGPRQLWVGTLS